MKTSQWCSNTSDLRTILVPVVEQQHGSPENLTTTSQSESLKTAGFELLFSWERSKIRIFFIKNNFVNTYCLGLGWFHQRCFSQVLCYIIFIPLLADKKRKNEVNRKRFSQESNEKMFCRMGVVQEKEI